jgi:hypothetical protein
MKPKIYIGCSLTQAPEAFKESIESLKAQLRAEYEILDFLGLKAGTPADVYQWDIHRCVATCDLFVAVCDYPAIGLGYELGVAVETFQKPTLAVAHKDTIITRLIQGIETPFYSFERYETIEELPNLIRKKMSALINEKDNA